MEKYIVFVPEPKEITLMGMRSWLGAGELYSARLSTGLFGYVDCVAGRRGKPGKNHVLFAEGEDGLRKLVELGFRPCQACKPHEQEGFWETVGEQVISIYGSINSPRDFSRMPIDANRLAWEEILPLTDAPEIVYVPRGSQIKERFNRIGFPVRVRYL